MESINHLPLNKEAFFQQIVLAMIRNGRQPANIGEYDLEKIGELYDDIVNTVHKDTSGN